MELAGVLREPHGSAALDNLAQTFGVDRAQTETAVAAILPLLSQQIERNTLSRGGLADVVHMLGLAANGPAIDDPAALKSPATAEHGNALLEQLLGSKDASRALAQRAAATSGLSETIIKMMLPYIVSMLMRGLARKTSGGLGDILAKLPQLGGAAGKAPGGGMPVPSSIPGSAPLPKTGGFGLPGPEPGMPIPGRNPYGDLSDIIRKGGSAAGGGGSLAAIVRNIIGSVLGFQGRGLMGWLIRLLVLRWGWGFVQRILGRLLLGR